MNIIVGRLIDRDYNDIVGSQYLAAIRARVLSERVGADGKFILLVQLLQIQESYMGGWIDAERQELITVPADGAVIVEGQPEGEMPDFGAYRTGDAT